MLVVFCRQLELGDVGGEDFVRQLQGGENFMTFEQQFITGGAVSLREMRPKK